MDEEEFEIWEGVYSNFEEAAEDGAVFDSKRWIDKEKARAEALLKSMRSKWPLSDAADTRDYILPLVVALSGTSEEKISVLDFGGGLGTSYLSTLASVVKPSTVEFHIVEGDAIAKVGSELFANHPNVHFHVELPSFENPITIVHAGSSLHYVEDWMAMVHSFSEYKPRYLVYSDLPAGEIETFVTKQNYYGEKIPVWFWNISEFVSATEKLGFRLIYQSRFISPSELVRRSIKMCKFPRKYRLGSCCQLLFERC